MMSWRDEEKKRMLELNSLKEGNPDVMLQTRYLENQFCCFKFKSQKNYINQNKKNSIKNFVRALNGI